MAPPRILDQWHPHWDDRNDGFAVTRHEPRTAEAKPRSYTWRHVILDQGQAPECTAFASVQEAAARPVAVFGDPVRQPPDVVQLTATARRLYQRIRAIDAAAGRHFTAGATSLAAAQAGQQIGWWKSYLWASSADEVATVLGRLGPVLVGTWVYESMFTGKPGESPTYTATGRRRGEHLYVLTRVDARRGLVYTPNSWGGWGAGWLEVETLDRLLAEDGEAFIPRNRAIGGEV